MFLVRDYTENHPKRIQFSEIIPSLNVCNYVVCPTGLFCIVLVHHPSVRMFFVVLVVGVSYRVIFVCGCITYIYS